MIFTLFRQHLWRFLPGVLLVALMWILWQGMTLHQEVTTDKMDAPFPEFSLTDIRDPNKEFSLNNLKGDISIVHVWASWCGVCIKEHEAWISIKEKWPYSFIGIVYRDDDRKVLDILKRKGDPYHFLLSDKSGNLGIELGLVGTPETFVVDANGVIRFHQLGPIDEQLFEQNIVPIMEQLKGEA